MTRISRREALASLGILGGATVIGGCRGQAPGEPAAAANERANIEPEHRDLASGALNAARSAEAPGWDYTPLDPQLVAETAYRIYPEGGCMFALVGSIVQALAAEVGGPYRSFPLDMMRYGSGGIGHWGSVCGIVNGSSAIIGLIHSEPDATLREKLIREFCVWYESESLPHYEPLNADGSYVTEPSVSGSVLCHISVAHWCEATGREAFSAEKKERCRRLTADGACKVVELLNREQAGEIWPATLTADVQACVACHGKPAQADAVGTMQCDACHTFDGDHP
jgi:hypothetical protein